MRKLIVLILMVFSSVYGISQQLKTFQNQQGLYGLKDNTGRMVLQPKYDKIGEFYEGAALVVLLNTKTHNDTYGFIDTLGNEIIPVKYDYAYDFSEGLARVLTKKNWNYINKKGEIIITLPSKYTDVSKFHNGSAKAYRKNGVYILIDKKGNKKEPQEELFLDNGEFKDGDCSDKYGFKNEGGKFVIKPNYDDAREFSEGLAAVRLGDKYDDDCLLTESGKWGFINTKGKTVIPFQFYAVLPFKEGLALTVTSEKKVGYINKKGEWKIKPVYDDGSSFYGGFARVFIDNKFGVIDTTGKDVLPVKCSSFRTYEDGTEIYQYNGKYGFIKMEHIITQPIYDYVWGFSEGLAATWLNGKCGFINRTGEVVIGHQYEKLGQGENLYHANDYKLKFSQGLCSVRKNGKWGFINTNGEVIIPFQFNNIGGFTEDLAPVSIEGKWGFVNKNGELVIPAKYDDVSNFNKGFAKVYDAEETYFINREGQKSKIYIKKE